MAFPEKVTYPEKYNLRPIVDPNGQFSAENANHIKEKINKNALFHGVHDNLAALQAAWQNPTPGHFAYLIDGSHYRCVNIGWTTNEATSGGNYFFGYHSDLPALRIAHPNAIPGARAIIKVVGANDQEALWDEDAQDWFAFEIIPAGVSSDPYQALSLGSDGKPFLDLRSLGSGGATAPTELISFTAGYQSGLTYNPTATYKEAGVSKNDSRTITADPADPSYDRFDLFVIDLTLDRIVLIKGIPAANPLYPEYDPLTQLPASFISIQAGATAPTGVVGVNIWTEGNEWSTAGAGSDFNFVNTESPASGTYAIKTVNPLINGQALPFTAPVPKPYEEGMEIAYKIKNISGGIYRWLVAGTKSNGRQTSLFIDAPFNYSASSLVYQPLSVAIPSGIIANITKISLVSGVAGFQYFLDDVKLVSGGGAVTGNYVTPEQLEAARLSAIAEAKAYTDSVIVGGSDGNDNVHDSYNTMADMYAGQGTQLDGEVFVVVDASAHSTVDAGWAFFEYLGTTFGNESDYRKLSEQESLDVIHPPNEVTQAELDAVSVRVTTLETKVTNLDKAPVAVSTSRLLSADDHKRKLLITAPITLTWPAGGLTPFECNFDIDAAGQLTMADQAATPGNDLDAPDGKILEAGKMAHAYKRPDNIKLRLKGTWKV